MPVTVDREWLWLKLLRSLTVEVPNWLACTNLNSALSSHDVFDSAAAALSFPDVIRVFKAWAGRRDLEPVTERTHGFGRLSLATAIPGHTIPMELTVSDGRCWRGYPLVSFPDLIDMAEDDSRGIRKLRPGAQGVLTLLLDATTWTGGVAGDWVTAGHVRALLAADPAGVRQAAALFGVASPAVLQLATAVVAGGWDRRSALRVEAVTFARGLRSAAAGRSGAAVLLRGWTRPRRSRGRL